MDQKVLGAFVFMLRRIESTLFVECSFKQYLERVPRKSHGEILADIMKVHNVR